MNHKLMMIQNWFAKNKISKWVGLCFSLIILFNISLISMHFHESGWDFKTFYSGVRVFEDGNNPYLGENLKKYSGNGLPFHEFNAFHLLPPLYFPQL